MLRWPPLPCWGPGQLWAAQAKCMSAPGKWYHHYNDHYHHHHHVIMMASPRSWSGHWSGASHAPPPCRPSPRTLCCMPGSVIIVDIRLTRWHWPSLPGTPGSRRRAHTSWWRSAAGRTGGWRGSQIVSSKSETSRPGTQGDNKIHTHGSIFYHYSCWCCCSPRRCRPCCSYRDTGWGRSPHSSAAQPHAH